ncbi:MAG: SMC-Scp complex subunit ScpB [Bacilli bacterium]|nr:SMC-Scp complex subunit ScpB [Bacilli bacterium]MDD4298745.1 SMC-Scp complex subunit ScpB [Bacilli bacterium]MDD4643766.1 SMC-Scp complex subunit ScpB [Bacilli bacterium]
MNLKAILEGLLFVVGEDGLTLEQITDIMDIDEKQAKEVLMELRNDYESEVRGVRINFLGNTFKLTTKSEHKDYYQKLIENPQNDNLSQSALEILAIVVYNEPITRVQVDAIRGVNSSQMMRKLVAKGFLKEVGRSDMPGRPIIYKTTNEFLDYFGLASKDELPKLDFLKSDDTLEEMDLFSSRYKEE